MDTSDNFRTAVFARNCAFGAECRTSLLSKVENSFTIKYSNISKRIIIKYAAVRVPTYNYMYPHFLQRCIWEVAHISYLVSEKAKE